MRYVSLFFGIGFLLAGTFWAVSAYKFIATAKKSLGWPKVSGIVTKSGVIRNEESFLPSVEYQYEFSGRAQIGTSIHIGAPYGSSESWANSAIARYPIGRRVDVAVNPGDPTVSALEPGTRWHVYLYFCAGLSMTLLGIAVLYLVSVHWYGR